MLCHRCSNPIRLAFLFIFLLNLNSFLAAEDELSEFTKSTLKKLQTLNHETGYYGGYVDQSLIRCTQFQDLWLYYLHKVESTEEYYRGMDRMYPHASSFRTNISYASEIVNFFNPGGEKFLYTHALLIGEKDKRPLYGFLNTFRTGRELTTQERAHYWLEEAERYHSEVVEWPFPLTSQSLSKLQAETVYNYALRADGSISIALERPGQRTYYTQTNPSEIDLPFTHPNHTILAGKPHQVLLTAGSLLFYQVDDRRLYFISNRSGHFVPYFYSLHTMVDALADLGVNPHTIVSVPDLDIASIALKLYRGVQVPITLEKNRIERLFQHAHEHWIKTLNSIDINLLSALAEGNLTHLTDETINQLNRQREEATYMRSAYHLFSKNHRSPKSFYAFVRHFGQLKDAIRYGVKNKIQSEAATVLQMLQKQSSMLRRKDIPLAEGVSTRKFLTDRIAIVKDLLACESLSADDFHTVKKWSRELGVLFKRLAEDSFDLGKDYFLYSATAKEFLHVNEVMAKVHDDCVRCDMQGMANYDEIIVKFSSGTIERMELLLSRLRIPPDTFTLDIPSDKGFWLINCAKNWYHQHYRISTYPWARKPDNYDPRAKHLLERIVTEDFQGIESSDDEITVNYLLAGVLRAAEYARTALIFIDARHEVDEEINDYIFCLRRILYWIRYGGEEVTAEAMRMLQYMEDRGIPSRQLESYKCTEQKAFDTVLNKRLETLQELVSHRELPQLTLLNLREEVLMLRDILELFRHAGVKYQSFPMVCYDEAKDAAERLLNAIDSATLPYDISDNLREVSVTEEMLQDTCYLLNKLYRSDS